MCVCVHTEVSTHVILSGFNYWCLRECVCLCVDLLSRVSRQDGYRGEVGAAEKESKRGEKDNMVRTTRTPQLPSHTDMK